MYAHGVELGQGSEPPRGLSAAPELRLDLVADVARCSTYVQHTRDLAERAGCSTAVQAELGEIGERQPGRPFRPRLGQERLVGARGHGDPSKRPYGAA
jgi:hypothetical protein